MASPSYQAQQRTQLQAHDVTAPPADPPAASDPNAPCSTELQCQQQLVEQSLIVQQYSQDTDLLASKSLANQTVAFDVLLGILFCCIVGVILWNVLGKVG